MFLTSSSDIGKVFGVDLIMSSEMDSANLPTMTGIGTKEEWQPVYHGQANGLLDKAKQREAFIKACRTQLKPVEALNKISKTP